MNSFEKNSQNAKRIIGWSENEMYKDQSNPKMPLQRPDPFDLVKLDSLATINQPHYAHFGSAFVYIIAPPTFHINRWKTKSITLYVINIVMQSYVPTEEVYFIENN